MLTSRIEVLNSSTLTTIILKNTKPKKIFLSKLLFGDGASSGTVEISLANLPVVIDTDGNTLKTLADYFNSDGAVISDVFKVQTTNVTDDIVDLVVIDNTGITIGGYKAATTQDILNNNS